MQPLLAGITVHSDTNFIADFLPTSRMKCHMLVNPPHSPNSELRPNLLMAITGNVKKKFIENVVDSLRRKRLKRHTINLLPLHQPRTIRTNHRRNNSLCANLAHPLTTLILKKLDLGDRLSKDGKLTTTERSCWFTNNLCLFCGGVKNTARECPKSSSSTMKAKGHAAKGKSDKSEGTLAEDSKK
jgi:hypothetical protein